MLGPANRDDGALLTAARAGDRNAFGRLIERHRQGLELYCYLMLGDPGAADRAMADTVLTTWLELRDLDSRATVRRWLYGAAVRVCFETAGDAACAPDVH